MNVTDTLPKVMKSMFNFKITNNKEKIEKYRKMMGFFTLGGSRPP